MPRLTFFDILLQLLPYIFGTGGFVAFVISWKTRKATIKQTEATALEGIDAIYQKMTVQTDKQFDKMQKRINELESKLESVLSQCSLCPTSKFKR